MARVLADTGFEITFLERKSSGIPDREHPGIRYISVPEGNHLFLNITRSLLRGLMLVGSSRWRAVYALKPMPNTVLPALLARLLGITIAVDVDDLDFEYYPAGWARKIVYWSFLLAPRYFHAISYHVPPLREFLETESGIDSDKLVLLPQGIDLDVFDSSTTIIPSPIEDFTRSHPTIAYMASLGITSDLEDVLPLFRDIFEQHPDWGLLVIGHGVRLPHYRDMCRALGIGDHVLFAGYVSHRQVPTVLRHCRVGFHYLRPDGANRYRAIMKIREYLAAGLPVVANPSADIPQFAEYISVAEVPSDYEPALQAAIAGEQRDRTAAGTRFVRESLDWNKLQPQLLTVLGLDIPDQ